MPATDILTELRSNFDRWPPADFLCDFSLDHTERRLLWLKWEIGLDQKTVGTLIYPTRSVNQQRVSVLERTALQKIAVTRNRNRSEAAPARGRAQERSSSRSGGSRGRRSRRKTA